MNYQGFHAYAPTPVPADQQNATQMTDDTQGVKPAAALDTTGMIAQLEDLNTQNQENITFFNEAEKEIRKVAENIRLVHEQIRRRNMELNKEISKAANLPVFWDITRRIYKQLDVVVKGLVTKQKEMNDLGSTLTSIKKTITSI